MCHYKHLTLIEREKIMFFLAQNYSVTDIAKALAEINLLFLEKSRETLRRIIINLQ